MKIRIQKNFLRLRLSQTEVETFAQTGKVASAINFSPNPLVYEIITSKEATEMFARFDQHCITIAVPTDMARDWTQTDWVGFENSDQTEIRVLVEKDFKCLHKESDKDQVDNYPHPRTQ